MRRRFVSSTDSDQDQLNVPDGQGAVIDAPNQLWLADVSYDAVAVGFV